MRRMADDHSSGRTWVAVGELVVGDTAFASSEIGTRATRLGAAMSLEVATIRTGPAERSGLLLRRGPAELHFGLSKLQEIPVRSH